MKNVVFALLLTASGAFAQDLKEASSEKPSILEARLRDAKPAVETKLSDGASARIWIETANENRQARLAKALVKSEKSTKNEGSLTVKATFLYENGQLLRVSYSETEIVQTPTPSVNTRHQEFVYADGLQTSPSVGSVADIENTINAWAAEIRKNLESHVHTR